MSALRAASASGHVEVIRQLVAAGANVDGFGRDGNTALHHGRLRYQHAHKAPKFKTAFRSFTLDADYSCAYSQLPSGFIRNNDDKKRIVRDP